MQNDTVHSTVRYNALPAWSSLQLVGTDFNLRTLAIVQRYAVETYVECVSVGRYEDHSHHASGGIHL